MEASKRAKAFRNAARFGCGPARIVASTCMFHQCLSLVHMPKTCRAMGNMTVTVCPSTHHCAQQAPQDSVPLHDPLCCLLHRCNPP